ncbi:MAG: HD domain-containing protein [Myxococcales bacterium]|nr:HD domain-containing protein [Myxococcales bacterium]
MNDELVSLLTDLDGVRQSPRYHPEGDALFHSLQVFQLAHRATTDRVLWAAALFHDVGKAIDGPLHDEIGADLLEGLLPARAVWLVRHHLDLLKEPRQTRRRYLGTPALRDLEQLRRWDLGGRDRNARVLSVDGALDLLFAGDDALRVPDDDEGSFDPFAS